MTTATWPLRSLGSCAKFLSGGTPSKARAEYWEGDIPWVSSGEMTELQIRDTPLHISEQGAYEGSRLVPENTVLAVVRGMSLAKEFRVSITKREVAFNQDLKAFACEPDIDPEFLFYALRACRERIRDLASDASHGTKRLETEVLSAFQIPVPRTKDVQHGIVAILSAYDDLIENNRRRIALLDDAALQLYREWFVRLRFPGHRHACIINGVPTGWDCVPFDAALVLQRGFDLPVQDREDGDVPIYGSTGISGFHSKAKVAGPGVITGRSGTLGEVHYVRSDFWPLNTSLWVKEFKRVSPLFAVFLMREMDLRQYNGGVSVPTLDRKTVHKVQIVVPAKGLLTAFDEFVEPMFHQIDVLSAQVKKLRTVRDLLLPRLMSGETTV
jgi:type I restriction enzyme, S subunit